MATLEYLFNKVNDLYGNSNMWISDLAKELGITYSEARQLTKEAGYYRHKKCEPVTLDQFEKKPWAQHIQMKLEELTDKQK